jgi:hypothetical protein
MPGPRTLLAVVLTLAAAPLAAQEPKAADPEQELVATLAGEKPFLRGEYKVVRAAFARYFERKFADDIKAAFGDDHAAVTAWLDANPEVKETFYAAIDPDADDVRRALEIFRDLYKLGPDKLKAYPDVAIAVAVTWDDPKAVYDYRGHQVRTKSHLPDEVAKVGPVENYEYLTAADGPIKTAAQALPWEFLVHVVNHRTPADERDWAKANYLKRRAGVGASYQDVRYDEVMLKTKSEVCKLNDQPYTLPSIKQHGGVCAMQADFAARVAKSLAVPAEYVRGEANFGGLHAWVMWVEVKSAAGGRIDFALLSEGRYFGDQYFVGTLEDPKTGKVITDRDLERRLTFLGQSPLAARQADLLMRAFPVVKEKKSLTTAQQLDYLRRVRDVFPSSERAWLTLAEMTRDGRQPDRATAARWANQALTIFAKFPDFSWRIADDLLTPITDRGARARLFERLVAGYEGLGRPDLACEARLKLVGYQVEGKEWARAAAGLEQTVRKFPAEGRYVPKMMAKLREVCEADGFRGGADRLAKFYLELLPRIPKARGDEVSRYCVRMHEQALEFLRAANKPKEAARVEQLLSRLGR